ncbi:hypothetical protein POREN0001_1468 [Porphyromonas endodontalis ATCC 35406]|uniref:Uncharacterized protein n=1 Tax=Porphyromonas endodontalis (strain ATCC 35406 / DSM 24491 / JCM 8526 / CCUG 16442 / BCRC 14492 / NCTC 13058 / HG 370) TaxID=553175 RepID=C3J929_POREA|nr:hypothetical protein POREN0001_1468 [Porphyromonas endodontalis ATCC 35406]
MRLGEENSLHLYLSTEFSREIAFVLAVKCSDFAALRFSLFRVGIKDFMGCFLQNLRQKSEYFPADSFLEISLLFAPFSP